MQEEKLLIIDGCNLLFQMFFGMPARIVDGQGKAIQGTWGFVGALLKMIRMTNPTHIAVLFDGQHENSRQAIDADYKKNRLDYSAVDEAENPFSQLQDVRAALDVLGIAHAETADCEADDWIAGYARAYGKNRQIVIASFDSDFFQLITERVAVLRYRGERTTICTPGYIRDKLGIKPEQYADFKAMIGDQADNIRGADGIGQKTAAALLEKYGCLDEVLSHAQEIGRRAIRETLVSDAQRLKKNRSLIALEDSPLLPFELDALVYHDAGMKTGEVLRKIGLR